MSHTNRVVGGVCVAVVPRVQLKLSRALHAHRRKTNLQDFQTLKSVSMKRAMVRFKEAREKGTMVFVEMPGDLVRRHDGGPPVERDLRQEPGVA